MTVQTTSLPDVLLIEPRVFEDERGFFMERYHAERYAAHGIGAQFVQDNHSRSCRSVLRGLHFQRRHPQGKLVECVRGKVYDVVVDLRATSSAFGQWLGVELQAGRQLWVPPGFAHGFCVLSDEADFVYKCTDYYHADDEGGGGMGRSRSRHRVAARSTCRFCERPGLAPVERAEVGRPASGG